MSAWVGASFGLFVKLASNNIRKIPLRREPWDYPLFILIGAYAGYKYEQLENNLLAAVNEKRAALDQPPLQLGGFGSLLDFQEKKEKMYKGGST